MTHTSNLPSDAPQARPTSMIKRSIAPDLARGFMLLLIAVANAPAFLWGVDVGDIGYHPAEGTLADRVAQTIAIVAIDARVYPMFAFLFGYGIIQLYRRQTDAGVLPQRARQLLRRRHLWMIAFGLVHAVLLWYGDVVGAYGLAGLLLVWIFLDRKPTTVKVWVILLTALLAVVTLVTMLSATFLSGAAPEADPIPNPNAEPQPIAAAILRTVLWASYLPVTLAGLVVPISILIAFLVAQHRVLEQPAQHVRLLRWSAAVGITIGWGTGLILALQNLDVWGLGREADLIFSPLHSFGGLFGGLGYVALFGLIALRLERTQNTRPDGAAQKAAGALQAVGKRSLSFYLAQSVFFAPLMSAWGIGLGAHLSSWSIAVAAVGIWLITVALAVVLEKRRRRGPAEWALRRLMYAA